jgi:L-ribulose-5-phosphate 3-epimerase
MGLKNRLGGHTNSYHTYSCEEALEGIAAAGFKFVELSAVKGWSEHVPLDADGNTLGGIQRMLNKLGLIAVSLSGHSDLTSASGLEDGIKALDLCQRLGIDIMNTAVGGHYSEHEDEAGFMGNIFALADAAAQRNIQIGLEIHGEITSSCRAARPIIERINRPNVRVNYDTANVEFYGGLSAVEDLPDNTDLLIHCHLKDKGAEGKVWDFPAVGKGHIDFKKILNIFKKSDYSGPFTVEIEFSGEPWPELKAVNKAMRQSYKTLSELGLS